jgi:GNAT superfamily N-acetyltransferase
VTATEALQLADRCLANTVVYFARHAGGAADDRDGVVLFAGAHPYPGPFTNGAIRLNRDVDVDGVLARARNFFAPRRRGFVLWTRADADSDLIERCRTQSWHERPPVEGMPIIRIDRAQLRPPADAPPDAPPVDEVRTEADAQEYLRVLADAYGVGEVPSEILDAIFCSPAAMLGAQSTALVTRVDGRAVAGSMVVTIGGLSCSLYTATVPAARRTGLGTVCLMAALRAVFDAGIEVVYAQSSQMGLKRWLEIGFEEIGHYHRFLVPPQR